MGPRALGLGPWVCMLIDHPIENGRRGGDASAIFAREAALADSDGFPEPEQADFCL